MENIVKSSHIMEALTFKDRASDSSELKTSSELFCPVPLCPCMLCEEGFTLPDDQQALLTHLYSVHRLVIADVDQIAYLRDYVLFWKQRFIGNELAEYCCTMLLDKTPEGEKSPGEKYYLLSDVVPIDNQLRRDLQRQRLEQLLARQAKEREDNTYSRECLFCRTIIKETRAAFLQHLNEKHNFYIAKTENLVFVDELIETLSDKLDGCVCIFCEKTFKDRNILKEHMRKKNHKRINPSNKTYDKYFITNYLEMGKNWQSFLKSASYVQKKKCSSAGNSVKSRKSNVATQSSSDSDNNWSDWNEQDTINIICLFCKNSADSYRSIVQHLREKHDFDFDKVTAKMNFYEKVKIVNYIRRQMHIVRCISCNLECENLDDLLLHMSVEKHLVLNDKTLWNQPEFFFSTYEDDGLLCFLEDEDDQAEDAEVGGKSDSYLQSETCDLSEKVALAVLQD